MYLAHWSPSSREQKGVRIKKRTNKAQPSHPSPLAPSTGSSAPLILHEMELGSQLVYRREMDLMQF